MEYCRKQAEELEPTNEYELFRCLYEGDVGIMYRNSSGRISLVGEGIIGMWYKFNEPKVPA